MIENTISTTSELVQDNSSVEYVAPEKNPIATVPSETQNCVSSNPLFDFNATHNGEACIESLDPKDRGTERRFRFTRALLCTLLGVKSENTITNHVQALINRGVVTDVKNLTSVMLPDSLGRESVKTTLYDAEKERSDALEAQNKALQAELDEAIHTKSQIGDKKVASAMGTAGALSKKCDRLEKELDKLKSEMEVRTYNARQSA